jgi:hypothetical protein
MITKIPEKQVCEAFDPMMFLPEKTLNIIGATQIANPSCVAPAFVYIEGSHGKKFLCDFHYFYEMNMTRSRGNTNIGLPWESIQEFILDERERVKETFAKDVTSTMTLGHKCSVYSTHRTSLICTADALVHVIPKENITSKTNFTYTKTFDPEVSVFYCNFHFRKNYYRYYSNGINYEDIHEILDERYRMNTTIAQEALDLTCV